MPTLIDASLWVDVVRSTTPPALKQLIVPYLADPETHLAEPVLFELLRNANAADAKVLKRQFQTVPLLATPPDLWTLATDLGQACRQKSVTANAIDLLIAAIAIAHAAEVVTFDADFQHIAGVSSLKVKLLQRPMP